MSINIYCYTNDNGEVFEIFDCNHITHNAVKEATNGKEFWKILILPSEPTKRTKIVAQRDTMEEAIKVLEQLANGTFPKH